VFTLTKLFVRYKYLYYVYSLYTGEKNIMKLMCHIFSVKIFILSKLNIIRNINLLGRSVNTLALQYQCIALY